MKLFKDQAEKVKWSFIFLFLFYSIISVGLFLRDEAIIKKQVNLKNSIESTDLSGISIENLKVGERVKNANELDVELYFEDGTRFYGWKWEQQQDYSTKVIQMIRAYFQREGAIVKYNGIQLSSTEEMVESLGGNYVKGLKVYGETDTFTYIDKENNIELVLKDETIYLKRIDDQLLRMSMAILDFHYEPISVTSSIVSNFKTKNIFDFNDYYLLPIYFTMVSSPILLLFIVKERRKRKNIIILNLVLGALYGLLFWYFNIALPMIGV